MVILKFFLERLVSRLGPFNTFRALSKVEFPDDHFPDYCLGITYFMTLETSWKILRAFEVTLKEYYIWIEDVYLTGEY